jgi:hypothetical protein
MPRLQREDVNKKNTYTWEKVNNDSRKTVWRREFVSKYGGKFEGELWKETITKPESKSEVKETRKILVINPDGNVDEVENFTKYCRERELSRSAMYEVMKGLRKQHKGYRAKKENEQ